MYYKFELDIIKNFQKINNKLISNTMVLSSVPFHFSFYPIILCILYFYNKIKSSQIYILFLSQIIIIVIKCIFKRERPYIVDPKIKLLDPMIIDKYSFPSGHTMNAFILYYMLNNNDVTNLYIIPYLVAISRVYLGAHYPSDVVGGMVLAQIIMYSTKHRN